MIEINNIRINPEGDKLIIDAQIAHDSAFSNVFFKKVYIDTQDSYLTSGPSNDLVYEHDVIVEDAKDENNNLVTIDNEEYVKKIHLEIPQEAICASLKRNFFIIYLEADGEITENLPSCETDKIVVGCTFWMRNLYQAFLGWIREINNTCEVPKNYLYLYLQFQALLTCVRTGNMMEAIKIYNKYIRNIQGPIAPIKGCGCKH